MRRSTSTEPRHRMPSSTHAPSAASQSPPVPDPTRQSLLSSPPPPSSTPPAVTHKQLFSRVLLCFVVVCMGSYLSFKNILHPTRRQAPAQPQRPLTTSTTAARVLQTNTLAVQLFHDLREHDTLISPLSVASVLALVRLGSESGSRAHAELTKILGNVEESLSAPLDNAEQSKVDLEVATSLWMLNPLLLQYIDKVHASAGKDGVHMPPAGPIQASDVNAWVSDRTRGKIPSLVDDLPRNVIALLVNAVYFKAPWTTQFKTSETKAADFYVTPDRRIPARMMYLKHETFPYASVIVGESRVQLVQMSYGERRQFAATFVVPPEEKANTLDSIVEHLRANPNAFTEEWLPRMNDKKINKLGLPRFRMEYGTKSLAKSLQNLGIKTVFKANETDPPLAAMTDDKDAFVHDVLHKAVCEFTEAGTVASAATAAVVMTRSLPIETNVVMNRPFLFLIHERASGLILFMGRVDNPQQI